MDKQTNPCHLFQHTQSIAVAVYSARAFFIGPLLWLVVLFFTLFPMAIWLCLCAFICHSCTCLLLLIDFYFLVNRFPNVFKVKFYLDSKFISFECLCPLLCHVTPLFIVVYSTNTQLNIILRLLCAHSALTLILRSREERNTKKRPFNSENKKSFSLCFFSSFYPMANSA